MLTYLIILLDDTSVSFCHYLVPEKERRLIALDDLKAGVLFAMNENLNVQFVYPDYELPTAYTEIIDSIDHTDIVPKRLGVETDVIVMKGWDDDVPEEAALVLEDKEPCQPTGNSADEKGNKNVHNLLVLVN